MNNLFSWENSHELCPSSFMYYAQNYSNASYPHFNRISNSIFIKSNKP